MSYKHEGDTVSLLEIASISPIYMQKIIRQCLAIVGIGGILDNLYRG